MRKVSLRGGLSIYIGVFDQSIVLRDSRLVFRAWALIAFFFFCLLADKNRRIQPGKQSVYPAERPEGTNRQIDR